ncbi:MAG: type I glyceraldehyde-3-phosphate dehydrogenase [Marinobacterium sp.]|nr:type I glyceraldehyde-3-phosphate dehydrogenase [Marinobacterium sp.]
MTIRVAINGAGRIGRNIIRALYESGLREQIQIIAINDPGDPATLAHLLQYDSVHGRFNAEVNLHNNQLYIHHPSIHHSNEHHDSIRLCAERDPAQLPWAELAIDLVHECTGLFTGRKQAAAHLQAGAQRVLISAPSADADTTVVYGINHQQLTSEHRIISNASCTTNCLAPIAKALHDSIGIESGLMTTIHAYTNDQNLTDVASEDLYRARCATQSMIPTKTGAAAAVGLVLPELAGRLDGMAVRVPTVNVSLVDLSFIANRTSNVEEVNGVIAQALDNMPKGVLVINPLPLVSIDFNHNPASSIFDSSQTRVNGRLVKVMAWYDNEWGFSNRMLDVTVVLAKSG